jgi:hypothetical protein
MQAIKRSRRVCILLGILILTGSWGFLVHKTVHQLAIYELPAEMTPFFYQNMEYLVTNAPRPDTRRNTDSTEATKHFIDLEMYGTDAAHKMPMDWDKAVNIYSKDSLLKYGYVPYHVIYMKGKLTEAFKAGNKDSILFYAADLGHYIGDAHVPLHTTVNYDGQLSNQKGLHSLWESMIPELEISQYQLYSPHKAKYLKKPEKDIWNAVRAAAALLPSMLQKEKEVSQGFTDAQKYRIQLRRGVESKSYTTEFAKAYAASLGNTINGQLIASANLLADFWYTSWVDAGKPNLAAITGTWADADKAKFDKEISLFKANTLLQNNQLLSKKTETKE